MHLTSLALGESAARKIKIGYEQRLVRVHAPQVMLTIRKTKL